MLCSVVKGRTGWTEEAEEQRVLFCCERKVRVDRGGGGAACYVLLLKEGPGGQRRRRSSVFCSAVKGRSGWTEEAEEQRVMFCC